MLLGYNLRLNVQFSETTMYKAINLREKLGNFSDRWAPRIVGELNDYQIKIVKIAGEFVWHSHADTDELFLVIAGRMAIDLRDGRVELAAGELFVVPKGVEHRPVAESECHILLIEPRGVINTGDAGGELTAESDLWV